MTTTEIQHDVTNPDLFEPTQPAPNTWPQVEEKQREQNMVALRRYYSDQTYAAKRLADRREAGYGAIALSVLLVVVSIALLAAFVVAPLIHTLGY